eukprot:354460-Chlamydomonas_euryale.AAC.12
MPGICTLFDLATDGHGFVSASGRGGSAGAQLGEAAAAGSGAGGGAWTAPHAGLLMSTGILTTSISPSGRGLSSTSVCSGMSAMGTASRGVLVK